MPAFLFVDGSVRDTACFSTENTYVHCIRVFITWYDLHCVSSMYVCVRTYVCVCVSEGAVCITTVCSVQFGSCAAVAALRVALVCNLRDVSILPRCKWHLRSCWCVAQCCLVLANVFELVP